MIDATAWRLTENPRETPFFIRRDFEERNLARFWDDDTTDALTEYIYSVLNVAARFYVDDVYEGAPFSFILPETMPFQDYFIIESPRGPIRCWIDTDKYHIYWRLVTNVVVQVGN